MSVNENYDIERIYVVRDRSRGVWDVSVNNLYEASFVDISAAMDFISKCNIAHYKARPSDSPS